MTTLRRHEVDTTAYSRVWVGAAEYGQRALPEQIYDERKAVVFDFITSLGGVSGWREKGKILKEQDISLWHLAGLPVPTVMIQSADGARPMIGVPAVSFSYRSEL